MSLGPIELVAVRFGGTDMSGEVMTELQRLVDARALRIVDVLFGVRFGDEPAQVLELTELEDELVQRFEPVVSDVTRLIRDADVQHLSVDLAPDSAIAVMLLEHAWLEGITEAAHEAGGEIVMAERIPRSIADQAFTEQALVDLAS